MSGQVDSTGGHVVALCGGVGGVKLALGLMHALGPSLTIIVNTGDDFEHLGLSISPDIDTALYTLSGRADAARGWGRADESWRFMEALAELGGETWFQLGDRDLALHVERTRRLSAGERPSAIVADIARAFGIASAIAPMSDDPVRTMVETDAGDLPFQRYFVERRCAPRVRGVHFVGADIARPSPAALAALTRSDLEAIVICPSNPYLSVDPILAVPGLRQALEQRRAPVVAVSPIIGGVAIKGPTAKIMQELGRPTTTAAIAAHYGALLDILLIDESDRADAVGLSCRCVTARTLMTSLEDRVALARRTLAVAREYGRRT